MKEKSEIRLTAFHVWPGNPMGLGAHRRQNGVNFALNVQDDVEVELLLYRSGEKAPCQVIPMLNTYKTGLVTAVMVEIPKNMPFEYNYRVDGFIVPDPFARVIRRVRNEDGETEEIRCSLFPSKEVKTEHRILHYRDCVFYKLNVRGFTMLAPGVKHPGTFTGLKEKLGYLSRLGVTSLILMPVYEFNEYPENKKELQQEAEKGDVPLYNASEMISPDIAHLYSLGQPEEKKKINYWGYTGGLYYVPKESYCATKDPEKEFGMLVDAIHRKGMEVILEIYFDEDEASWRVVDILHHWVMNYHVDGFRIVGDGKWFHAVQTDPLLFWTKILHVTLDKGNSWDRQNALAPNLCEMNEGYEFAMRSFLKGDEDASPEARHQTNLTSDQYARINYFADNDGLTMADMVMYNDRHNEENGEDNQDGKPYNCSWNCGEEGPSKKRNINKLRLRQLKNAFLMLMTSQASPMIYGGDEFLNSQNGNNNAWCQDNEVGWLNWNHSRPARALRRFVSQAIAFRKNHPILTQRAPMKMMDYRTVGYPDLSYHGKSAWYIDDADTKCAFASLYCGKYDRKADGTEDDFIYIMRNMYWQPQEFALPDLPEGMEWKTSIDTSQNDSFAPAQESSRIQDENGKKYMVPDRTVVILIAEPSAEEEREMDCAENTAAEPEASERQERTSSVCLAAF